MLALPYRSPLPQTQVSAAMLTRGIRLSNRVVPAAGAVKCRTSAHQIFARQHSTHTFRVADAATVKLLEKQILEVNAVKYLSDRQKYRTSVRLFAVLDHCKQTIEIRELRSSTRPLLRKAIELLQKNPDPKFRDPILVITAEELGKMRVLCRRLVGLQWRVFRLFVFAPWEDIVWRERLAQIPHFVRPC
jgi:hypothetical protein